MNTPEAAAILMKYGFRLEEISYLYRSSSYIVLNIMNIL